MPGDREIIRIGMLGCGTIGSGVYRVFSDNSAALARSAGRPLEISRILVKAVDEPRPFEVDTSLMTTDAKEILDDEEIDLYIEVMGGIEPARSHGVHVLRRGKSLITANKELVARHGRELMQTASANGAQVKFEAAVGGGIPIIRSMEDSLGGEVVQRILGIVNGTTNYILSAMTTGGVDFGTALEEAQRLGFAEADPSADIEGSDAASKLAIMSSIAFGAGYTAEQVFCEGIRGIRQEDIESAKRLGYVIKLLAIASREKDGISARVHPTMIPQDHPLASVSGNFNAIFITGESVGDLMFYGQGAGSLPTATAIAGDVVNIARNFGMPPATQRPYWSNDGQVLSIDDIKAAYYMVIKVLDQPGVLAKIAGIFGEHSVSIESVVQRGFDESATIMLITHNVLERNFQAAKSEIERLDVVEEVSSVIRVELREG